MPSTNEDLLRVTLALLIERWGSARVRDELAALGESPDPKELRKSQAKRRVRRSASEIFGELKISDPERTILVREIAGFMDRKQFISSPSDAREFLIMHGARPSLFKDRTSAFRPVLMALARMSLGELRRTRDIAAHEGPARMLDISTAINEVTDRRFDSDK